MCDLFLHPAKRTTGTTATEMHPHRTSEFIAVSFQSLVLTKIWVFMSEHCIDRANIEGNRNVAWRALRQVLALLLGKALAKRITGYRLRFQQSLNAGLPQVRHLLQWRREST